MTRGAGVPILSGGGGGGDSGGSTAPSPVTSLDLTATGVFDYFGTGRGAGNPYQNPVTPLREVLVFASSYLTGYVPNNLTDRVGTTLWNSEDSAGQWVRWDLRSNRSLRVTSYRLSPRTDADVHQPRSWVLEGSDDTTTWTVLDTRTNSPLVASTPATFDVNGGVTTGFRYVRLRQTDTNTSGTNYFILNDVEFFGTLDVRNRAVEDLLRVDGVIAETYRRWESDGTYTPTLGRLEHIAAVVLREGDVVTDLGAILTTNVASTNCWMVIYNEFGSLQAVSENRNTGGWTTDRMNRFALPTDFVVPRTSLYYLGLLATGTAPTLRRRAVVQDTLSEPFVVGNAMRDGLTTPDTAPASLTDWPWGPSTVLPYYCALGHRASV